MHNGLATGVLNDQMGSLGMGVKWDNKMSFVIFSLVIFWHRIPTASCHSFCGSHMSWREVVYFVCSQIGSINSTTNKREKGLVGSDRLEKCESVSNVNNKQIKRKF